MIQMERRHWKIVQDILQKYPYTFYAFGSRVKGSARKLSDLDICFMDTIPWNVKAHMDEDFEESDLPYKVDIINGNTISDSFRDAIKNDLIKIQ